MTWIESKYTPLLLYQTSPQRATAITIIGTCMPECTWTRQRLGGSFVSRAVLDSIDLMLRRCPLFYPSLRSPLVNACSSWMWKRRTEHYFPERCSKGEEWHTYEPVVKELHSRELVSTMTRNGWGSLGIEDECMHLLAKAYAGKMAG
jgi:hypothetical protein